MYGSDFGLPVLQRAAYNDHLTVVEALLDAGAGDLGEALVGAAARGHTAVVALLLDRGADVNYDGDRPLRSTVCNSHLQTTTLLLDRGADPNAHPEWPHVTAMNMARHQGHHEIIALLLARGGIE